MTNAPASVRSHRSRLGVAAVVVAFASFLLSGCFTLNQNQSKNLNWVNQSRAQYGRRALPINPDAQAKAQAWAEKLASENRLYHSNLSSGIRVRWCGLAENVGYGSTTQQVHASFMRSSAHRSNILDTYWNGVGIGVARRGSRAWVVHVFIRTC